MHLERAVRFVIHDGAGQYTRSFDDVFNAIDGQAITTPPGAPRENGLHCGVRTVSRNRGFLTCDFAVPSRTAFIAARPARRFTGCGRGAGGALLRAGASEPGGGRGAPGEDPQPGRWRGSSSPMFVRRR